jgi:bisanhydrobacterioruberin hydratase
MSAVKRPFSIFVLSLVYLSGAIGMRTPWRDWFVSLTPLSLLLSLALLLWHHPKFDARSTGWICFAFMAGFLAEVAGVNTGLIFGQYTYGTVLGPKIWHTPLMIGVNWVLVTYCVNAMLAQVLPANTKWPVAALAGGAFCTALDALIEPVAIRLGFWTWADGLPPLHNYIGWLVVATIISAAYQTQMGRALRNPFAPVLLAWQVVFFVALW